jgi:hypothetical protein
MEQVTQTQQNSEKYTRMDPAKPYTFGLVASRFTALFSACASGYFFASIDEDNMEPYICLSGLLLAEAGFTLIIGDYIYHMEEG